MVRLTVAIASIALLVGPSLARPQQQPTPSTAVSIVSPSQASQLPSVTAVNTPGIGLVPVANGTAAKNDGKQQPGHAAAPGAFNPFTYTPGFSVAVFGAVAFGAIGAVVTYQYFTIKAWYFMLPPQAALVGFAGMVARLHAILHVDPKAMTSFIVQMMMSTIQPMLMTIATMMTFTRVIWLFTPLECMNRKFLGLPHHWISFIWTGLVVVQDITKSLAANFGKPKEGQRPNPSAATYRIQQIALCLQFFVMLGWTAWAVVVMKLAKRWTKLDEVENAKARVMGWACVGAGAILTWRTFYLSLENDALYTPTAYLSQHEWMYWVCAVFPMLVTYGIFIFYHPGHYLPREFTRFKFDTKKIEKAERARLEQQRESQESSFLQATYTNTSEPKEMKVQTQEVQTQAVLEEDIAKKV